ncbi:MAG: adenylate/guanylate cyclase domain-containing protein [Lachnospiraceae bacterium]|nr:adenylate/guanylate cyclase domain-containing protein [Lachnospiraceae bacterium]
MEKKRLKKLAAAGALSGLLTLALAGGVLNTADQLVADRLCQRGEGTEENIVLVGIDQKALEDIGPFQNWGRDILAMTIEALNESEACRPAVIGVDVIFAGETDPDMDAWLAEAAGQYHNVVTASAAEFGSRLVEDADKSFYVDPFSVLAYDAPYEALQRVTEQGHVNAMLDQDGILRHSLLYITLEDGTRVPSFASAVAQAYQKERKVNLPPTDAQGFWYVPYSGKPGVYDESISVADLISGEIGADYFAGKIVLIGPYAAGMQDDYTTAIDHARPMYGVEYQANVIQAMLRGDYKQETGDGIQLAVFFLLMLAGGLFLTKKDCSFKAGAALWLAVTGGSLLGSAWLYRQGQVVHPLWIACGMTILYVASVLYHAVVNLLEKRHVTDTFKRYVAPEIVNEILREGTKSLGLGGKLCDITVLFVDIRGFTTMSESLEPPQVVGILNEYLTLTSSCIMKHGGTLDKFIGDATMAFWGAPLPQEDPVMNAVLTALDMVEGSKVLAEKLQKEFGRSVSFGIGIHTGPAVVGNIGAANRMDYTAIGDTVNTASRLESNAPAGTIYISRAVADALGERIKTRPLDIPIRLKGKKEGFEILILEGVNTVR